MAVPLDSEDLVIEDEIYGRVILHHRRDALLIALIASPAFQRLLSVLQHGISAVSSSNVCGGARVTRYHHSIGAALLVRRLGASLEEQAAALLHDIAHTALSHTVDFAFGRVIHEEDKHRYLSTTNIPSIIAAHGFDPVRVLDESNYSLLERDSPSLCGDRVDYALRDCLNFGILAREKVELILADLKAHEGEIVCGSQASARLLSDAYMEGDCMAWSNCNHAALYQFAADTIKQAFKLGEMTMDDLWASPSCDAFWDRLCNSPHESIRRLAARVSDKIRVHEIMSGREGVDTLRMKLMPRVLDPTVLLDGEGGGTKRLTELDAEYAKRLVDYQASKRGEKVFSIEYV